MVTSWPGSSSKAIKNQAKNAATARATNPPMIFAFLNERQDANSKNATMRSKSA